MTRKYLFDHIYKAAGSSVGRLFIERLGVENVTSGLVEPLSNALVRYADRALVTGHFSFQPGQRLDRARYSLTLLRHPVDRLISHYYFVRNHVPQRGSNPAVDSAKALALEDYVESDVPEVHALLRNDQTRHFMPMKWDGTRPLSPAEQLVAAKSALEEYDLVGVFDEFGDFVHVLCCDAGWPPFTELPRINATRGRLALHEVSPAVRARLEELNVLDIELHEHARRLFAGKRSQTLRGLAARHAGTGNDTSVAADNAHDGVFAASPPTGDAPLEFGSRRAEVLSVTLVGDISRSHEVSAGEIVTLTMRIRASEPVGPVVAGFRIVDESGRIVFGTNSRAQGKLVDIPASGDCLVEFRFRCDAGYGDYAISVSIHAAQAGSDEVFHWRDQAAWLGVIANLGDHWEGAMKLYPQIACVPLESGAAARLPALIDAPGWQGVQHLALHAPVLSQFVADMKPLAPPAQLVAGEVIALEVAITNPGTQSWPATGIQRVCLSYRWLAPQDEVAVYDGERTPLPRHLAPDETVKVWMVVKAPPTAGEFVLSLTPLQEYVAWFDERGAPPTRLAIRIVESVIA